MSGFTESVVEDAGLAWLQGLGYSVRHGPDIAAGELGAERSDANYRDVVLDARLREALVLLNPDKTAGLADVLREALAPIGGKIRLRTPATWMCW